jgi:metal-sulfur cluster biosynthetic enzyme
MMVSEEQVLDALKLVEDPELHLDIVTLELIRKITIDDASILVSLTLTTPACPYGPLLLEQVRSAVEKLDTSKKAVVSVTFDPPWKPSEKLKALMGLS